MWVREWMCWWFFSPLRCGAVVYISLWVFGDTPPHAPMHIYPIARSIEGDSGILPCCRRRGQDSPMCLRAVPMCLRGVYMPVDSCFRNVVYILFAGMVYALYSCVAVIRRVLFRPRRGACSSSSCLLSIRAGVYEYHTAAPGGILSLTQCPQHSTQYVRYIFWALSFMIDFLTLIRWL